MIPMMLQIALLENVRMIWAEYKGDTEAVEYCTDAYLLGEDLVV